MEEIKFTDVYNDLKSSNRTVVDIPEETQSYIQNTAEEYEQMDILGFCIVTFSAVMVFATYPACISFYYDFVLGIEPYFKGLLSQNEYIEANIYVNVSSLFVFVAVPFYTLVMPYLPKTFGMGRLKLVERSFTYFVYSFLFNYTVLLIPLLFITSYGLFSDSILSFFLVAWLIVPGAFFSFIPSLSLLFFTSMFFDLNNRIGTKSHLLPSKIICELSMLLKELETYNQQEASHKVKSKLVNKIDKISQLVKKMHFHFKARDYMAIHLENRFAEASKAIESLKLCILLPESNSKKLLNRKVESILNIFISGNYLNLPRFPYVPFKLEKQLIKSSTLKRFISMLTIAGFISLPLLIWVGSVWVYELSIPSTVQGMLPILYSIWVLMIILSFSEKLAPDVKNIVIDMFKVLLNKK
jgi:hypothetical protein